MSEIQHTPTPPAAWRWRVSYASDWCMSITAPVFSRLDIERGLVFDIQALYAAPAAATVSDAQRSAVNDLAALVDLVAEDTLGPSVENDPDEESVGWKGDGPTRMTFGHVRRAQRAVTVLSALHPSKSPEQHNAALQSHLYGDAAESQP